MNRIRSREVAMELIYQMEIHKDYTEQFYEKMLGQYEMEQLDTVYIKGVLALWTANQPAVDEAIQAHLKGWKVARLAKLDLSILRMAVTEMVYYKEIPHKVSINEAVKIAQKYVDEKSGKFINGVLGHFAKEV
ncbi:transcription antitermination factor NusB [Fusibacter sp. JL298sf-3]